MRLMGLAIADIQLEISRDVGKGRLLTLLRHSRFAKPPFRPEYADTRLAHVFRAWSWTSRVLLLRKTNVVQGDRTTRSTIEEEVDLSETIQIDVRFDCDEVTQRKTIAAHDNLGPLAASYSPVRLAFDLGKEHLVM
jgi:hypothetical protein